MNRAIYVLIGFLLVTCFISIRSLLISMRRAEKAEAMLEHLAALAAVGSDLQVIHDTVRQHLDENQHDRV